MSGIIASDKLAIVDSRRGLSIATYSNLEELAWGALRTAGAAAAYGADEAAMCDAALALVEGVYRQVTRQLTENYDPARLRAIECWPFKLADRAVYLVEHTWYGFSDGGGLLGSGNGYVTAEEAERIITSQEEWTPEEEEQSVSSDPEELGAVACCVLTGRQYVDRLYQLCGPVGSGWELSEYGSWAPLPQPPQWRVALEQALVDARKAGFVVEVGLRPLAPLAMGNYQTVVTTRPARARAG